MADRDKTKLDPLAPTAESNPGVSRTLTLEGSEKRSAPDAAISDDELRAGVRLGGRYRLERFLGVGGMGAVWLAVDEALGERVALKFVAQAQVGSSGLDRMRDEVRLAQKVTHQNVCRTFDLEEANGRWFVKMEFVAGETLAQRLERQAQLPIEEALSIARHVVDGLEAAHARGIVHRDLKPANVILEAETGRVVLMDFGIARLARYAGATADGISGTPDYMAPEQARGREVDGRADFYSLGCMLYQMLVGEAVFPHGETAMAKALAHVEDKPHDPRAKRRDLPRWVSDLILRLLEKDPVRRPRDAPALRTALVGPAPRNKRAMAFVAGAVCVFIAVPLAWRAARRPPPWRPEIRDVLPTYEEQAEGVISPDGKLVAVVSDRERRSYMRLYLEPVGGGVARALTPPELGVKGAAWAPDQRSLFVIARTGRTRDLYRVPLDGGQPVKLEEGVWAIARCGTGYFVMRSGLRGGSPLFMRDSDGRSNEREVQLPNVSLDSADCDPAGQRMVYASSDANPAFISSPSDLWAVDLRSDGTTSPPRRLTHDPEHQNISPHFSPDGTSIIYSSSRSGHQNLWELPISGGESIQLTFGLGADDDPDISPDGKVLAFIQAEFAAPLFARSLTDGSERRITSRIFEQVTQPVPSPNGRELYAVVTDRDVQSKIVAISLDGAERTLAEGYAVALAPDGREVFFAAAGGRRIMAVAASGGTARFVAEVPFPARLLYASAGVLHMTLSAGTSQQAWKVRLDGKTVPVRELPESACLVQPAPVGGWTAVRECGPFRARLIAPGRPLDDPSAVKIDGPGGWTPDGAAYLFHAAGNPGQLKRHVLATGKDESLGEMIWSGQIAVSPDGKTAFISRGTWRDRRQLIVNFADRPRPWLQ